MAADSRLEQKGKAQAVKQVLGRAEEDEKTAEEKITAEEKKIGERKSREGAEGVRQILVIRPCEPGREEN